MTSGRVNSGRREIKLRRRGWLERTMSRPSPRQKAEYQKAPPSQIARMRRRTRGISKAPLSQIARMRRRTHGISESATESDSSDEETNTWNISKLHRVR